MLPLCLPSRPFVNLGALLLVCAASAVGVRAQIESGERGIIPVDSANVFEVDGIQVDVSARTAEAARLAGWRLAQRQGWKALWAKLRPGAGPAPQLPDGALNAIVAGLMVEEEQIGSTRYVARLGVVFDRARAGALLGSATQSSRSAPLLVIPVLWSGGSATSFEVRNPWQRAWAQYRAVGSPMDYVRAVGNGPDPLLLNVGQAERADRRWWRTLLDIYGAADVVVPTVRLKFGWPGGPVVGVFEAYHGPDHKLIGRFGLRASAPSALPALLAEGVKRLDGLYTQAFLAGRLDVDRTLEFEEVAPLPEAVVDEAVSPEIEQILIQIDTPDAAAVASAEGLLNGLPGVRRVSLAGLAVGGASLFRLETDRSNDQLVAALGERGWQVERSGASWRLRRIVAAVPAATPQPVAPMAAPLDPKEAERQEKARRKAEKAADKKARKEARRAEEDARDAARRAEKERARREKAQTSDTP